MGLEKIYVEYRQLQGYVGWSADDEARVRSVAPLVLESTETLVEDFYDEIRRHPQTASVITGERGRSRGSKRACGDGFGTHSLAPTTSPTFIDDGR